MRRILPALLLLLWSIPAVATDLTVVTWNLLNFPGSTGPQRVPYFQVVLSALDPSCHLLVCQEVLGNQGLNDFFEDVLDPLDPGAWSAGAFHDGYDTDRALFYRSSLLEEVDAGYLDTSLRDIDWWQIREVNSGIEFRVFTVHLKASQGSTNEQLRLAEVTILRNYLDSLPDDLPVFIAGDLNIYRSSEPAYQHLMSSGSGQLNDPIQQPGYWHDSATFAGIHTQSTRTTSFGGGATGGLDDRFDQILVSEEFMDGSGLEILPETYDAFGNDGLHFNQSIIQGGNAAVPLEVAEALHQASDHLPVLATLHFPDATAVAVLTPSIPEMQAWPNPFNPSTQISFSVPEAGPVRLQVYDVSGRLITTLLDSHREAGRYNIPWQGQDDSGQPVTSGVYLFRVFAGNQNATLKGLLVK